VGRLIVSNTGGSLMPRVTTPQARYWLLTIPVEHYPNEPTLSGDIVYLKGQQERGGSTGLLHWQLLVVFSKKLRLAACKRHFCEQAHCEPSRSSAANEYVWKEDTRVPDTQFEHGALPISRARAADWDRVYDDAVIGNIENIPKDILIRNYSSIKRIGVDNAKPPQRPNINVNVYWGESGVGKTRRAWYEAGHINDVYIKNPNTKWWDGYRGQSTVIIDEFVGRIDISYILTWLDRYPCMVEIKGYSTPLLATRFFFTSNVNPLLWYPDINPQQLAGLTRRIDTEHMVFNWVPREDDSPQNLTLTPNPAGQPNPVSPNPNLEPNPNPNLTPNLTSEEIDDIFSDIFSNLS